MEEGEGKGEARVEEGKWKKGWKAGGRKGRRGRGVEEIEMTEERRWRKERI